MRTYINYCGKPKSGKTTVLCLVIDKLTKKVTGKPPIPTRGKDRRIVFEINHQLVAISTYGDDLKQLSKNHRWFDEQGAKVMVTASHASAHTYDSHDHNLFIDNYIHNEITADNEPEKNRGRFNYCKIQSVPCPDEKEQKRINNIYADYICNLILESLKI